MCPPNCWSIDHPLESFKGVLGNVNETLGTMDGGGNSHHQGCRPLENPVDNIQLPNGGKYAGINVLLVVKDVTSCRFPMLCCYLCWN